MQICMHDVYDSTGKVKDEMITHFSGHKRFLALLPNLQLLNQHLYSKTDISIYEEAKQGLYFSFLGTSAIKTIQDIKSVQIAYQPKNISGHFSMNADEERGLLQVHISPEHLASVLGETEAQIIQHFISMDEKLSNDYGVIQLPFTEKAAEISKLVLSHKGHSISLAGHIYALIFTMIEQLQMLNHLSQCEDCQSKLFNAQNLIEAMEHEVLDINNIAQSIGLNAEALAIGFHLIVGQSIESYWTRSRIKFAAVKLRQDPTAKTHIVAQSGFSDDQFEAAFIQYFGVSSHQYGQIH